MNCKPGDLAINLWADIGRSHTLGAIVTVVRPYTGIKFDADWVIEWHGKEYAAYDRYLKPITPPRDSITSDEVESLYAPSDLEVVR